MNRQSSPSRWMHDARDAQPKAGARVFWWTTTLAAICLLMPPACCFQVTNVSRGQTLFQDGFEFSQPGVAPSTSDPVIGNWSFNGQPSVLVVNERTESFPAAHSTNFLRIARGGRPRLTALCEQASVAASQAGDTVRILYSLRLERGVVSLYPVAATHDIAQISFFGDGRVSVVNQAGTAHQFLSQTHVPSAWNSVALEQVNGASEWKVSINGAPPESRPGGSSDDGASGGLLTGFRLQTDAEEALAYFDLPPGIFTPVPSLTFRREGPRLYLQPSLTGYALEESVQAADPSGWWTWPAGLQLPAMLSMSEPQEFFRLRKEAPSSSLPKMLGITWTKGPDLPQGFQDSDGGILAGHLITAVGYCSGQTDIPGKATKYPPGFLRRVWGLNLSHPEQGWWDLPQFPGVARQEIFGIVVADQFYCWGGFSYDPPFCYRDGYRLSRPNGAWRWDTLPSLPWPLCSAAICALGSKIYVFGGADYDLNRFYTNDDRARTRPRLGARLLSLDTENIAAGWKELPQSPGTPRFVAAMAAVHGRIVLIGGAGGDDNVSGHYCTVVDNWCFDPPTQQWLRLQDTPIATGNFPSGAIVYQDRYLVLVGGYQYGNVLNPDGSTRAPYGSVYKYYPNNAYNSDMLVYDAKTARFGTADPLPLCNNLPMAVLSGDTLHLIGGETGGSVIEGEPFGHHPDLYLKGQIRVLP